jgi:hypothetical protein
MTLTSHLRSVFAFGTFFVLGGAWLALVTTVRTQPLTIDSTATYAATATTRPMSTPRPTIRESNLAIYKTPTASPAKLNRR